MKTNQEPEPRSAGPSPVRMAAVVGLAGILIGGLGAFFWQKQEGPGLNPPPAPGVGAAPSGDSPDPPTADSVAVTAQGPESLLDRGRELSLIYCASCHLYPKPEILDRFTWAMETLPRMSYWLGLSENDLTGEPGLEDLVKAGALPTAPLLPVEDWRAICNFYIAMAPLEAAEITSRPLTSLNLKQFAPRVVPSKGQGRAHNSMVRILPGQSRLLLGSASGNTLDVIDLDGVLLSRRKVDSPPVDAERAPGGWLISLIGSIAPVSDSSGSVVFLPDSGGGLTSELTSLRRPVQTQLRDLDGDGRPDRLINEFGNVLGGLFWQRNLGNGAFARNVLLEQPGAARSAIADFNGDGRPDIAVIMAQARESVILLMNDGKGGFTQVVVAEYHPAWGNVHLEVVDFNDDGRPDLLTVNGDNADYIDFATPRRAYHGVRALLNEGPGQNSELTFREAFFFPMYGAYKALARDFDEDGDLDIAACAYYPDYLTRPQDSFVYLENRGDWEFLPSSCSEALAGRWISMDAADADGDGDLDVVLSSFLDGPGDMPEQLSRDWDSRGGSALYLENQLRK